MIKAPQRGTFSTRPLSLPNCYPAPADAQPPKMSANAALRTANFHTSKQVLGWLVEPPVLSSARPYPASRRANVWPTIWPRIPALAAFPVAYDAAIRLAMTNY